MYICFLQLISIKENDLISLAECVRREDGIKIRSAVLVDLILLAPSTMGFVKRETHLARKHT